MKEVHEILDFIRLEHVSKGGHGSTTIVNLKLYFLFAQAFPDRTQIWPQVPAATICTMAVFTTLFMKERGSGLFAFV
jgi:hypothetical protein